jgi:hypothetical protein
MVGSHHTEEAQQLTSSGTTVERIADKVALLMSTRGYRLESGGKFQGVYGRGSGAGHALLGPLW